MYAVILAGGSGTRLWPLSRELYPKQLLKLTGNRTLLQETADRLMELVPPERILTVTNRRQRFEAAGQLSELSPPLVNNVFVEPLGRNTAAAIALAAAHLLKKDPSTLMLVAPADHLILDRAAFAEAVEQAAEAAEKGGLVTFGLRPTRPETGFGYIEAGPGEGGAARKVKRFVEKPDRATAEKFLADGGYYWNSGMFLWTAGAFRDEAARVLPELAAEMENLGRALEEDDESPGPLRSGGPALRSVYERLPAISVDHGLMERTDRAWVVPADLAWSDIGSWESLYEISEKDGDGNVLQAEAVNLDSTGCLVLDDKRLVALVGCRDLAVISTADALLVCDRARTQEVGRVVEQLKTRQRDEYLVHRTVHRPWGAYTILEEGERFRIKHILVHPEGRLSLQMHYHRSEHWVVLSGAAKVTLEDRTFFLRANESAYIPLCTKHRLENPGTIPLSIIEVQNGDYLGEDDIVRFDDTYGRDRDGED